ncbi:MAG: hypothetical protein ACI4J1_10025 [Ruminiclostridium sp.]
MMTFKDEYKKDNQNLSPDPDFLKALAEKMQAEIDNPPQNEPHIKIAKTNRFVKYGAFAAGAVLVIGAAIAIPFAAGNILETATATADNGLDGSSFAEESIDFKGEAAGGSIAAETTAGDFSTADFAEKNNDFDYEAAFDEELDEVAENATADESMDFADSELDFEDEFDGADLDEGASATEITNADTTSDIDEIVDSAEDDMDDDDLSYNEEEDILVDDEDDDCADDDYIEDSDDCAPDDSDEDTDFDEDIGDNDEITLPQFAVPVSEWKTFNDLLINPDLLNSDLQPWTYVGSYDISEDCPYTGENVLTARLLTVLKENSSAKVTTVSGNELTGIASFEVLTDYGIIRIFENGVIKFSTYYNSNVYFKAVTDIYGTISKEFFIGEKLEKTETFAEYLNIVKNFCKQNSNEISVMTITQYFIYADDSEESTEPEEIESAKLFKALDKLANSAARIEDFDIGADEFSYVTVNDDLWDFTVYSTGIAVFSFNYSGFTTFEFDPSAYAEFTAALK